MTHLEPEQKRRKQSSMVDYDGFWKKKSAISFLCSLMVVIIHVSPSSFPNYPPAKFISVFSAMVSNTVVRIAVPLFFIINGVLMFRDYTNAKYLAKLRKRFFSLFLPYVIWNTAAMLFLIAVTYSPLARFTIGRELFKPTVPNVLLGIFHYKYNGKFWFVFNVIVFSLLTPVIDILIRQKWSAALTLAAVLGLYALGIRLPNGVFWDASSIVFYLVGCILGKHGFADFARAYGKRERIISGIVCLGCFAVYSLFALSVVELQDMVNLALLIVFGLSFWVASDSIMRNVRDVRIYEFSFLIYAVHQNVISCTTKLLYLVLPRNVAWAVPNWCATLIITIVGILLFGVLMKKYLPKTYKVISGAR